MTEVPMRNTAPYSVVRTPRGSVVFCAAHIVTEELKDKEAEALANALNAEFKQRMAE